MWKNNIRTLTFSLLASEIYTYFIDPMKLKQRKIANYLADKKISSNFAPLKWHSAIWLMFNIIKIKQTSMIIVPVKDGENIERALKKFKRKFEKTGVVKELRSRQQFDKPSVKRRLKMERAIYVQHLRDAEE